VNIKRLNLLLAVVERGSYVAAGEHVHLAHSAVHRQIKLLEQEVGATVLVRQGRGVQLTDVGKILIGLARRLNAQTAEARSQIDDLRALRTGSLRIGTGTTTLIYFLREVLDKFRSQYPAVDLRLTTGTADEIITALREGRLEFGIVSEPPENSPAVEKGLRYLRLYTERFVFAVQASNPRMRRDRVEWEDIASMPLICLSRGTRVRAWIDRLLARCGKPIHVSMELENEEAIVKMVELGLGVGVVAARRGPGSQLRILNTPIPYIDVPISAIIPSGYVSRCAKVFLDLLLEQAATEGGATRRTAVPESTKNRKKNRQRSNGRTR